MYAALSRRPPPLPPPPRPCPTDGSPPSACAAPNPPTPGLAGTCDAPSRRAGDYVQRPQRGRLPPRLLERRRLFLLRALGRLHAVHALQLLPRPGPLANLQYPLQGQQEGPGWAARQFRPPERARHVPVHHVGDVYGRCPMQRRAGVHPLPLVPLACPLCRTCCGCPARERTLSRSAPRVVRRSVTSAVRNSPRIPSHAVFPVAAPNPTLQPQQQNKPGAACTRHQAPPLSCHLSPPPPTLCLGSHY